MACHQREVGWGTYRPGVRRGGGCSKPKVSSTLNHEDRGAPTTSQRGHPFECGSRKYKARKVGLWVLTEEDSIIKNTNNQGAKVFSFGLTHATCNSRRLRPREQTMPKLVDLVAFQEEMHFKFKHSRSK